MIQTPAPAHGQPIDGGKRSPMALYALTIDAFGIGTTEFVIMGLLLQLAADLQVSVSTAGLLISGRRHRVESTRSPTAAAGARHFPPADRTVELKSWPVPMPPPWGQVFQVGSGLA